MVRRTIVPVLCCLALVGAAQAATELLAHWPLDESVDGLTPDETSYGNALYLNGGVSFVEGNYGMAASFDGQDGNEDSIASADDIELFDPGAFGFTATAWVTQGTGDSSQNYEFIVSKGNATSGNVGWSIWTEAGTLMVRCNSSNTSEQRASQKFAGFPQDEWVHVALVLDRETAIVRGYLNGSNEGWAAGGGGPTSDSLAGWGGIDSDSPLVIGQRDDGRGTLLGEVDDVRLYGGALTETEVQEAMARVKKEQARQPQPEDGASDVPCDASLAWTPGEFAATHDVYLGRVFSDVNDADRGGALGVLVSESQDANAYDPDVLEFGQTYYWRVDEVNGTPDGTIFKGEVWSFGAEPLGYPIETISVTASSFADGAEPENVINGSGLDENGLHSSLSSDMWLSSGTGEQPTYIEFDFGRMCKMHQLLVWNYNVEFEDLLGYGSKDVTITYSENGVDWTTLGDFEFTQGISDTGYAANTTVDFSGVAAQMVRLTVNSDWAGRGTQYGLSEVRFLHIPVQAREPQPADGQTEVEMDAMLSWRSGREALTHDVYLSTDSDAVLAGTAQVDTVTTNGLAIDSLDLGTTYYWKVNEVNEVAETVVWEGNLWSFVTQEFVTVDDFESYDDEDHRVYDTWVDGWINGSSSTVGYYEAPFAEMSIVHGGRQSMPVEYMNMASPYYSEAEYDAGGADWTAGGADTLRLYVWGQADNDADTFYVALEDTAGNAAVVTYPDTAIVTTEAWQEWVIGFDEFSGVDMTAVRTVYVGVGERDTPSAGGSGIIYVDDVAFGRPVAVD